MSENFERSFYTPPGSIRGPQTDKGLWPDLFNWKKSSEGENIFMPKEGFRFCNPVPAMHADKAATQSIPSATDTIVLFDSVLYDYNKNFSPHTGIFQVRKPGLYNICVSVQWAAATWTVGQNISLWIVERVAGLKLTGVFTTIVNASSYAYGASCSITVPAYPGNQLCAMVRHNNAAARSLSALGDLNCLSVCKVGDIEE